MRSANNHHWGISIGVGSTNEHELAIASNYAEAVQQSQILICHADGIAVAVCTPPTNAREVEVQ